MARKSRSRRKHRSVKRVRYTNKRRTHKRGTHKRGRRAGVPRATRPNVDTLTNLFARLNPTGEITKSERVPMKVEKKVVDSMDELTSMFSKMKGHEKRKKSKSKHGIRTKTHKKVARNPFA